MKKKLLYVLGGLSALLVGVGWYLLDFALRPEKGRDVEAAWQAQCDTYPAVRGWRDSLLAAGALRDTVLTAEDGTPLHAYYVRAARPTRRTALLLHGYTDNAVGMMMLGRMYERELGCNLLLPDLRYAGESGGTHVQMGWLDRLDAARWLALAPPLFGDSLSVVVHGVSMGAATAMMLSGDSLPPYVKAFVEDCGYTSVWAQFRKELKEQFSLPAFPVLYIASALCGVRYGWTFGEASALEAVRRCRRPMLFIHGTADDYVPTAMVYELYAAKPQPKELWAVAGVAHAAAYRQAPDDYRRRVANFLRDRW